MSSYPLSVVQNNSLRRKQSRGRLFPLDYVATTDLRITGVTINEVVSKLSDVLSQHESLRTTIQEDGDDLRQIVGDQDPSVERFDSEPAVPGHLGLASGTPLACAQVWPDGAAVRVRICGEHTIIDGESLTLLARELARQVLHVDAPVLRPSSYVHWSARQHEFLKSDKGRAALAGWHELLGEGGTFPDHPLWESTVNRAGAPARFDGLIHTVVEDVSSAEVRERLRVERSTPSMLALALLASAMDTEDHLVIHTPFANRFGDGAETIGWLAHGLPIRVRRHRNVRDQLAQVRRDLARSLSLAAVPLPAITGTLYPAQLGVAAGRRRPRLYVDYLNHVRSWSSDLGTLAILPDPWPLNHGEPGLSFHFRLDRAHPEYAIVVPPEQTAFEPIQRLDNRVRHNMLALLERHLNDRP